MKLGFDGSQIFHGAAGCGFFAKTLFDGLLESNKVDEITLYRDFGDFWFDEKKESTLPYSGAQIREGPIFKSREACAVYWNAPDLDARLFGLDLIHSNNFWCPAQAISPKLIYTLYDLGFLDHPEWTTEENRYGCFEGVYRSSLYADFVVAISEFSRKKYLEYFPYFPAERIGIVHPTSRFEKYTKQPQQPTALKGINPKAFWLCVSTIEPRKNQLRLLDIYKSYWEKSNLKLPLIFAGGKGWLMDDFIISIRERGLEQMVILTGYVSDEELMWLYQNCFGNLYPALYEGFGLPVLEGMQFGAPTVCSNTTSLPEVAGDGAIQLAPLEMTAWKQMMLKLETNKEERLAWAEKGPIQAAKFSSSRSVEACLECYQRSLKMGKRTKTESANWK